MKDRGVEMLQGSLQDNQSTQQNDATDTVMVQYNVTIKMCCVYFLSTQKQPGCKKSVALFKMASVKKVVKSKGATKKWLHVMV